MLKRHCACGVALHDLKTGQACRLEQRTYVTEDLRPVMLLCMAEASTDLMQSLKAHIETRMTRSLLVAGWRHDAFHTPTSSSGAARGAARGM